MEQEQRGKCHIVDNHLQLPEGGSIVYRKTVVNSVTDTNPENFAVKERQKDRRLTPEQEYGINV